MFKSLLVISCLLLNSNAVFAWGDLGHQAVAMVAQKNLSAEATQGILDILGPEDLALAAIWPDAVRNDSDFDGFKPYHFVEIPVGEDYENMAPSERAEKDAYTVIHNFPEILKDSKKSRSEKIIALRYLIHVMGDIHQPLHVGNGLDRGGNLCDVLPSAHDTKTSNLHSIWDTNLVELSSRKLSATHVPAIKYYSYVNYADDILKKHPMTAAQISKIQSANYFQMFKEAAGLRSQVYLDNPADEKSREYCRLVIKDNGRERIVDGNYNPSKIPVLSDSYKDNSVEVIETQLITGGLRLATLLNTTFAGTQKGLTKDQILKVLQLVNPN